MKLFENLAGIYDELTKNGDFPEGLWPIGYQECEIQIEIKIDEDSNFLFANFIDKNPDKETKRKDSTTLVPITCESQARTGSISPHMIFDDLRYLSGDLDNYIDNETIIEVSNNERHAVYMEQLEDFLNSAHKTKSVEIIYNYLNKNSLIKDLISDNILVLNKHNKLETKIPTEKDRPEVFSFTQNSKGRCEQYKLLARFVIVQKSGKNICIWKDKETIQAFSNYYLEKISVGDDIDYNTGIIGKSSEKSQRKIRYSGDGAKIFSSNDTSSFTYRGIFEKPNEARLINQIISDKVHNTLRYLIKKQGIRINEKVILIFGNINDNNDLGLNPIKDTLSFLFDNEKEYDSYEEYAKKIKLALYGFNKKLKINDDSYLTVVIMDSMVPGRLSINYYNEYHGEEISNFYRNIEKWHEDCAWYLRYYDKIEKVNKNTFGNDSLYKICLYAYGIESNEGMKCDKKVLDKNVVNLMLDMFNGRPLNYSLVKRLTCRAKEPQKFKNHEKILKAACQINKKYYNDKMRKEYIIADMANQEFEINYQLGRLLAAMELIEKSAERAKSESHSETNTKKYFSKYFTNPMRTYEILYKKILPYEKKMQNNYLLKLRQDIISCIDPNEFKSIKNLDGRALCGYDAQISEYYKGLKTNKSNNDEREEN